MISNLCHIGEYQDDMEDSNTITTPILEGEDEVQAIFIMKYKKT